MKTIWYGFHNWCHLIIKFKSKVFIQFSSRFFPVIRKNIYCNASARMRTSFIGCNRRVKHIFFDRRIYVMVAFQFHMLKEATHDERTHKYK